MIKLDRDRDPKSIKAGFRGKLRVNREKKLITRHLAGEDPSSDVWKTAKDQLKVESHGKCAYCESKADHVAHGDVEHFRPKSVYWWLAYCYDNYAYSCQICNQTFKSANFPIKEAMLQAPSVPANLTSNQLEALAGTLAPDPTDQPTLSAFLAACAAEEAHLPDPYVVDPETFFKWEEDDVLKEVEVRPRTNSARNKRAHKAAVDFLGLNREELMRWRWEKYDLARVFVEFASDASNKASTRQKSEDQLRKMMHNSAEFAAMIRHLVRVQSGLAL